MKRILASVILLLLQPNLINEFFVSARPPELTFDTCDATSTNLHGTSTSEFQASNALTPGLDFWCSEAALDSTEEVIWKGSFTGITELKGLEVVWAYPPHQIKILGRADPNSPEHVILNWRSAIVQAGDPNDKNTSSRTTEKIEFPKGVEALILVKIVMKGTTNPDGYIGIQQVRAVGSDEQIFTLISGITSPAHEQCLQALSDTRVTVDDCLYGIAHGDGRDIWQLTRDGQLQLTQSSDPELCLHYQQISSGSKKGGEASASVDYSLSLHSCSESDAHFDYLPNSQIRATIDRENKCLVVQGKKPSFANLLSEQSTGAEASTSMDVDHEANNALSQDSTYWSSTAFTSCAEHDVFWQYDFGMPTQIDRVVIDWEYPALAYGIMVSDDGATYHQATYNPANPHNRTEDDIGESTRYLRVSMFKPHPIFGQVDGGGNSRTMSPRQSNYVYGIKQILVQQNMLKLSLQDCAQAAQFTTAGDKWFKAPVRLFDADTAKRIKTNADFDGGLKSVQDATADLYDRLPSAATCQTRAKSLVKKYNQNIQEALPDLQLRISALQQKPINVAGETCATLAPNARPGMTYDFPMSGILGCQRGQPSGFYYFKLPCSVSKILRLFCTDDGDALWLYTGARTKTRKSTLDIERACASEGLRPTPVRSIKQLDQMIILLAMAKTTFNESQSNIPLAFDLGCTTSPSGCMEMYYDLATLTDVTGIVSQRQKSTAVSAQHNAAIAITSLSRNTPLEAVDWISTDQIGYMCATTSGARSTGFTAKLECGTTALSPIFRGGPNTFVRVACPSTCLHSAAAHSIYGGKEGAYADLSSVCTAALHRSIKNLDGFLVALESPHSTYPSISAGGLDSKALSGPTSYAFRIMDADTRCPVEDLIAATDSESLQLVSMKPASLVIPTLEDWQAGFELGAKKAQGASLNQAAIRGPANKETLSQLNSTLEYISNLSKVDGTSVTYSRQTSMSGLTEGRALVKPLETTLTRFTSKSDNVFMNLKHQVKLTMGIVAAFFTKLEDTQRRVELITKQRNRRIKAIVMDSTTRLDDFEAFPSGAGTLVWSVGSPQSRESKAKAVLKVAGSTEPTTSPDGDFVEGQPLAFPYQTFLAHRSNYFYDFSLTAQVTFTKQGDILMIGWRVKKATGDGYWLLLKQSSTELATDIPPAGAILAKLIRRTKGRVSALSHWVYATVNDPSVVIVDIHVTRARHTISLDGKYVVDLLDELATSGFVAVGVYSMPSSSSAEFDMQQITPHCCQRPQARAAATAGSHHGQVFLESPNCYHWDGSNSPLTVSQLFETSLQISKQRNYLGRPLVFEASSFIRSKAKQADRALTPQVAHPNSPQAILLKPRGRPQLCSAGVYALDFMLPRACPDAEIGPIIGRTLREFEWIAINAQGMLRAYRVSSTSAPLTVLAETYLNSIQPDQWHTISTVLTDSSVGVALYNSTGKSKGQFTTSRGDTDGGASYLGLAFQGCDRMPFTRLKVRP